MQLEINQLSLAFQHQPVLQDISLRLEQGQIGCLLGGSGCGKTTLLRTIAGFEKPHNGEILGDKQVLSDHQHILAPDKRRIGMMFQDFGLFPQMTVLANVTFGLKHLPTAQRKQQAQKMLNTVGLSHYANRYPHELSGGQQQRVALARALAPDPKLLLLDEPFSNLDTQLRDRLSLEVRDILKASNTTALLVTHDQNEAFAMSDKIGVMTNGRIVQWDSAYGLYHKPESRFVANFVGDSAWLVGEVQADGSVITEIGHLPKPGNARFKPGQIVEVLLRPDDVQHDDDSPMQMNVIQKAFRGADILYTLQLPKGGKAKSLVPSHHNHPLNAPIGVKLEMDHIIAFAAEAVPI